MPLKSLAEIRGGSSDSPSSIGGLKSLGEIRGGAAPTTDSSTGLKSLQDIRFGQQQKSLTDNYNQMVDDEQNYIQPTPLEKYGSAFPSFDANQSPLMKQVSQYAETHPTLQLQSSPKFIDNPLGWTMDYFVPKLLGLPEGSIGLPSDYAAKYATPDAPDFNHPASMSQMTQNIENNNIIQPGTNARQEYEQMNPIPSTGNKTVDNVLDKFGQFTGPMMATYGTGMGAIPGLVDDALGMAGVQFGKGVVDRIGKGLVTGAISGAPMGAAMTAATEEPTLQNVLEGADQGILWGGALGGAGSTLGAGLSAAGNKLLSLSEISKKAYSDAVHEQGIGFTPFSKVGEYDNLSTDTKSQLVSKTKGESTTIPEKVSKSYSSAFDNLQPINQFDKEVENVVGRPLNPSEKAYMQGLNSRGSDMISRHILTDSLVDHAGNIIGPSLKSITKEIPKGKLVDFEDYLINKDAGGTIENPGRLDKGIKVFDDKLQMTGEKSRAKAAEYEAKHPEFKQIAEKIYDFKNKFGKAWLADAGGIFTPDQWDAMVKENPFHVRMQRSFKDIEKASPGKAKNGFANQSNPIKNAVGSQRKIISPIESLIEDIDRYVKTAKRNQVMQTIVSNLEKNPEQLKGFGEVLPLEQEKAKSSSINEMNDIIKNEGIDGLLDKISNDLEVSFNNATKVKNQLDRGNVVKTIIDGKPVHVKINDAQLLTALTRLQPEAQNAVIRAVGAVTRMMKTLTTGINPVFSLTRNIFRDIPTAYINSKTTSNPVRFAWDLLDSFVQSVGNGKMYRDFKAIGGGHSSAISADRNLLAQSKNAILNRKTTFPGAIKKGAQKVYHGIENFNNALETAPRLAEFKRITQAGNNDIESKIKGLFEANDVTVNFNRYGDVGKQLDAFFPYMNAALQGLDKFVRVYKDNPVKATVKSFSAVTIPTVVLYAINHNDSNYQKLSNYVKDTFLLIPMGNGKFFKIPKSREVGLPFGTLVERAMRHWWDHDPESFRDFTNTVITTYLPPGVSSAVNDAIHHEIPNPLKDTIAGPFSDLAANKDFANRPIVPGDLQKLSPQNQYDDNTSEIAKKLGEITGFSPKQLDFLAKSYLGGVAQFGIPANTQGKSVWDTLTGLVTADPAYSNDISRYFYDAKTKYDQQKADAQKQGTVSNTLAEDKYLTSMATAISKIRKQMDFIQKDRSLTDAKRQQQLRQLQIQINDMQNAALNGIKTKK